MTPSTRSDARTPRTAHTSVCSGAASVRWYRRCDASCMFAPRRILVPHDFTGPSTRACDYALELAAAIGAAVHLVHVVEPFSIPLTDDERGQLHAGASKELERTARLLRPHVREVITSVVEGRPWEGIEAAATDGGADLIVMGTHGRRGVARALMGSVAAHVSRTSSVPVTTVPDYVAVSRNSAGVRLAAALGSLEIDGANVVALSRGALTVATALAERTKASLDFWAVEPIATTDGIVIGAMGQDEEAILDGVASISDALRDDAIASAHERLRAELSALNERGRSLGNCRDVDVVLVADGLFSAAYARVAISALRKLGPRRVVVASPILSRGVLTQLEGEADAVVGLVRATVAETCAYRDDVVASDRVASELLAMPHPQRRAG